MKLKICTAITACIASASSAEIVNVEFDLAGLEIAGSSVYGFISEEISHYENATILDIYWTDVEVSLVADEATGEGNVTLRWLLNLPEFSGLGWYTIGVAAAGPSGDYTISAGSFSLASFISDVGAASEYPGYNYGAGATGTLGSTINSGTLGFTVDVVPSPGALALIGLAGLGRRRRA